MQGAYFVLNHTFKPGYLILDILYLTKDGSDNDAIIKTVIKCKVIYSDWLHEKWI